MVIFFSTKHSQVIHNSDLNWNFHISCHIKLTTSRLNFLYHLQQFCLLFTFQDLIHLSKEYASHVSRWAQHSLFGGNSQSFCFTSSLFFSYFILPLKICCNYASLYIFYCYFRANFSFECANCTPLQALCTKFPTLPQPCEVQISDASQPTS